MKNQIKNINLVVTYQKKNKYIDYIANICYNLNVIKFRGLGSHQQSRWFYEYKLYQHTRTYGFCVLFLWVKHMDLKFNSFKEFVEHRKINKVIYNCMNYNEKRKLKNMIYYILEEKNDKKNLIWEYLNEPIESEDFIRISIIMNEYWRER